MSDQKPPRRRIAGESKPGERPANPPRRVVRKPVARPGVPQSPRTEKPAKSAKPSKSVKSAKTEKPAAAQKNSTSDAPTTRREAPDERTGSTVTAASTEKRATPSDAPAESGGGVAWSRPLAAIAVLAALAVAFGVVGGILGVQKWRASSGVDDAQDAATEAAATATKEIFSYNYKNVKSHLASSQKLMTKGFAKKFETISPTLNQLAPQRKIQVTAEAREAAAVPCGDDCSTSAVTVLVFFDQGRLADGSKTPTVFGNRVTVEMKKIDGDWKVDDIRAL